MRAHPSAVRSRAGRQGPGRRSGRPAAYKPMRMIKKSTRTALTVAGVFAVMAVSAVSASATVNYAPCVAGDGYNDVYQDGGDIC